MGRDDRNRRNPPFGGLGASEFARRVNTGSIPALDRMGLPMRPEMMVIYHPSVDTIYEIVNIAPVLDPTAPQGLARVTLTATFEVMIPLGRPVPEFVLCGFKSEDAQRRAMLEMTGASVGSAPEDTGGNGNKGLNLVVRPGEEPPADEPPAIEITDGDQSMLPPKDEPPQ